MSRSAPPPDGSPGASAGGRASGLSGRLKGLRQLRGTPKALLVQVLAFALALLLARLALLGGLALPVWGWVVLQALCAAGLARLLHSDRWWFWIHLGFAPGAMGASALHIPPVWYFGLFVVLAIVYGSHFRSQVPLFLSNSTTEQTLLGLIPSGKPMRFLDFGSGLGGVVRAVAAQRPLIQCDGVEGAMGPALLARLLALGRRNCDLRWGDFWKTDLSGYDIVYAFLSPVPMPAVWEKACREMKPDTLLISNSFPVPGVKPVRTVQVNDRRSTRLYVYRIPLLHKKSATQ